MTGNGSHIKLSKKAFKNISALFLSVALISPQPLAAGTASLAPAAISAQNLSVSDPVVTDRETAQAMFIDKIRGEIFVKRKDAADFAPVTQKTEIKMGDTIKAGAGICELSLAGHAAIMLSPNSVLAVSKATLDQASGNRDTYLELSLGRLKAKIDKLPKGSTFQIVTPTAVAAVRGTTLYINSGSMASLGFTELFVDESSGGVYFKNLKNGEQYWVNQHQGSSVFGDGTAQPPRGLSPEQQQQFVHNWESQNSQALHQTGTEETNNNANGSNTGNNGGTTGNNNSDASKDKQNEQNTIGAALLGAGPISNNPALAAIYQQVEQAVKDLNVSGDIPSDDSALKDLETKLSHINTGLFDTSAAAGVLGDASGDYAKLQKALAGINQAIVDLNAVIAANLLADNPSNVTIAQNLYAKLIVALTDALNAAFAYDLDISNGTPLVDVLLGEQHDVNIGLIHGWKTDIQNAISQFSIPDKLVTGQDILREAIGLKEVIKGEGAPKEWSYASVKYDDGTSPFGTRSEENSLSPFYVRRKAPQSGNGDLGIVNLDEGIVSFAQDHRDGITHDQFVDKIDFLNFILSAYDFATLGAGNADNSGSVTAGKAVYDWFNAELPDANALWDICEQLKDDKAAVEAIRQVERTVMREEVRYELDRIRKDISLEREIAQFEKTLDAQTGKVFTDANGCRVRVDQYIFKPTDSSVNILSMTLRTGAYQPGVSSILFGVDFNRPITGLLRKLPWVDYFHVVTSDQMQSLGIDAHYDQYVVHEQNPGLARTLYPTHFYAEFKNPVRSDGARDMIRFDEVYGAPQTYWYGGGRDHDRDDYKQLVAQGLTADSILIAQGLGGHTPGSELILLHNAGYFPRLYLNGSLSIESNYLVVRGGQEKWLLDYDSQDGSQAAGFTDAYTPDPIHGFNFNQYVLNPANHDWPLRNDNHPAFFEKDFIYLNNFHLTHQALLGVFIPIDNDGNVLSAAGFGIHGLRDILSPNPNVNGGQYNLEIIFAFGNVGPGNRFSENFRVDTIITPEIFTPDSGYNTIVGGGDSHTIFPAYLDSREKRRW